jgi:hypothetical protein
MKILPIIILLGCVVTPACAQQNFAYPADGDGLLDYCNVVVAASDSPATLTALSGDLFTQQLVKLTWCAGYLQATKDNLTTTQINLAMAGMMGVTMVGPDAKKEYVLKNLHGPCVPDRAPIAQIARVLVKWLREHPDRLHDARSVLILDALKDAFPCSDPVPTKDANRPTPPKP